MGGASIRLAEIQADNIQYSTAAIDDRDATVLSVSLAFELEKGKSENE
jgi:hypothetical protein